MSVLKVGAIQPNSGTKVNITGSTLLVTTASGHFSGSYEGDGSRLEGVAGFPFTGSGQISGSLLVTGSANPAFRVSGSSALTGSLFVSGAVSSSVGFSGSFQGDGSSLTGLATNLTVDGDSGTQDVSLTADDLQILGTANEISTAVTKVSNDVKVTLGLPDTVAVTASVATRANALAPTVTATSASVAARATTLSAQATASFADVAGTVHDGNITNAKLANDSVTIGSTEIDLGATATTLTGLTSISATTASFVLQTFESSSTVITSGSNIFGDKANDIQQITGSLLQTGSMTVIGNISASVGGFSGSFQGDGTLLTGVIASGSIQSASVATRANTLSPAATAASSSTAILAQTASVAGRANDLAPTVTATSASTAVLAQTASVAIRANALAPTATASFADSSTTASHTAGTASIANIATYTSEWILGANGSSDYTFTGPGFTASTADPDIYLVRGQQYKFTNKSGGHPFRIQVTPNGSAGTQYNNGITNNDAGNNETLIFNVSMEAPEVLYYQCTSHAAMGGPIYILDTSPISSSFATSASIATTAQTASVALRANALAPTVTATSASVAARATTLSAAATASFADISTLARAGSGSFSGSFQGDGSNLSGIATTLTVDGDSGTQDVDLQTDDLQILGTANEIETAITKAGNDIRATISLPDDVTIGQDLTVTRDATITRNLTVQGTASFQHTTDLDVADRFIRLASGSNAAGDGGIAVIQSGSKNSETLAYDSAVTRWGFTGSFDPAQNTIVPEAFVAAVVEGGSGDNDPTDTIAKYAKKGNIFVADNGEIYVYSS